MKKSVAELFLGKEVQIYPGDTHLKFGIVESVDENGVVFKITKSKTEQYTVGKLHYISFSARLTFKEI